MTTLVRAYSTLDIKAASDASGKRLFSGIASTPTVDSMGDIVEPKGASFDLPLPLLWQHDSRQPIGWVKGATVKAGGIDVQCELALVEEAGKLKDRLDEAWQSLKAGLVRGLSIGFAPIETARIDGTYGYRYIKWAWRELSAVTIPANADCSIAGIKSADQAIRRATLSARGGLPVVRLDKPAPAGITSPGDSGAPTTRRKGVVYLK